MTELRRRMREDLQLAGFAVKTQKSYIDAVRRLARHYKRSPDLLTEEEVRRFFLYLINDRKSARSTVTIYLCGIKFFYETTLKRTWNIFDLVRPRPVKKLPVVLSVNEVRTILSVVRKPIVRMALTIIYSCGLRVSEAAHLRVEDIDGERCLLWVRNSKGGKDRSVPLSEPTLTQLRKFWRMTRATAWFFPGKGANRSTLPRCRVLSRLPCVRAVYPRRLPSIPYVIPLPPISLNAVSISVSSRRSWDTEVSQPPASIPT